MVVPVSDRRKQSIRGFYIFGQHARKAFAIAHTVHVGWSETKTRAEVILKMGEINGP